jgi:hypothetical protein
MLFKRCKLLSVSRARGLFQPGGCGTCGLRKNIGARTFE